MSALLQIREVPDETRQVLKARAASAGTSLNSYLLALLAKEVERPTVAEVLARAAARSERSAVSSATIIREERERRERQLTGRRREK